MRVAVLVPVLNRPERVEPLVASIKQADERCDPVFLCSPGDTDELDAVAASGVSLGLTDPPYAGVVVPFECGPGDYARKINYGFAAFSITHEWLFLGADDLVFHEGWLDAALHAASFGRPFGPCCVVGTNDLGNARVMSGQHATHSLVHRDYLACGVIDGQPGVLYEGYDHNFVDTEFVATARWRDTFVFAADSRVEHLHPFWGKNTDDATYRKGREHFHRDRGLFESRSRLWS